jgi:acyl-CoA thioester hydrolase
MPPHVHRSTQRVVMNEVDVSQIHFTMLYRRMDRAVCEWLAEVGRPFQRLIAEGLGTPIVDTRCRIIGRVLLDDELTITTAVAEIGTTSFRTKHAFTRGAEPMAEGELVHVCIDRSDRRPIPVPGWLRDLAVPSWPLPGPPE